MSAEFNVDGLDSLMRKLENMGKEGRIIEGKSLVEAVQPMLEDMKNTSQFKDSTGELRKNLKISSPKRTRYGDGMVVWIGDVDKKTQYSWYVEYGSTKSRPHEARPFMQQAYSRNKANVYENLKEVIEKNLQKGE